MGFLAVIGNAIWAKLEPLLTARLDKMEADANAQLTALRTEAMAMLKEALPEMASAIAESTVSTVFKDTLGFKRSLQRMWTGLRVVGRVLRPGYGSRGVCGVGR